MTEIAGWPFPTGGKGLGGGDIDQQGAIRVDGNYVLAVNPGSNSVAVIPLAQIPNPVSAPYGTQTNLQLTFVLGHPARIGEPPNAAGLRLDGEDMSAISRCCALCIISLLMVLAPVNAGTIKIGVLKFGTVSWELDVIKTHGLDKAEGIDLQIIETANTAATTVALQAGAADVIVTDWLWVSRQRSEGARFTFLPYSTSVGALVVPANSPIATLPDLKGKKLGIAGGPVDKSWLLIRALAEQRHGLNLDNSVDKVFGAPPLLNEEILSDRLDAIITSWNFAVQLTAKGFRELLTVEQAARELGIKAKVPFLGYVFDEAWANQNKDDVMALVRASRKAKEILARSDFEWDRLRPLMKAADDQTFAALREGYRVGIPEHWGAPERADAAKLFKVMARLGGAELAGKSRDLQPGTFWADVSY